MKKFRFLLLGACLALNLALFACEEDDAEDDDNDKDNGSADGDIDIDEEKTGFNTEASGPSGLFIVLNPALAEKMDGYKNDKKVNIHEATLGQAMGGVFITSMQIRESGGDPVAEESAGDGDYCETNDDCIPDDVHEIGYCESYQTAPPDPEAECIHDMVPEGSVRLLGTLRNFETGETLSGVKIKLAGALPTITDPMNAPELGTDTTDKDGRFAIEAGENATKEGVGLVANVQMSGYANCVTGLVEPEIGGKIYPPGARNHDVWAVKQKTIDDWSALLEKDVNLAPYMPLGESGGSFGIIRNADTGEPMEGIKLKSRNGESSQAIILYYNK